MRENKAVYESQISTQAYNKMGGLLPAEEVAFRYLIDKHCASALDIGAGAGRTAPLLSQIFTKYLGIDHSQPLIQLARKIFLNLDFRVADARSMKFEDQFDCMAYVNDPGLNSSPITTYDDIVKKTEFLKTIGLTTLATIGEKTGHDMTAIMRRTAGFIS